MKTRFNKLKIFSKKLKEDKMKDKDWEDLLKKMRKIDKEDKMSKKQNKTINCQQDLTHSEKSGLLQPADIHNREQEFDLIEKTLMFKPILNPNQMAMFHRYIKQAELKGIKLGKQIRKDEIMKIIRRRIKFWTPTRYTLNVDPCRNKKVELEELEEEITKQKIKGDEK